VASTALPYRLDLRATLAGGEPWPLLLDLDLRGLEAVTRAFERAPLAPAPLDGLLVPLAAEIGRTRLPLADLGRAAAGDLLLLEEAPSARGDRLDLVLGGVLAFACELLRGGTTLSYTGEARARVPDGANAAVETLDEVPVELVFELGRVAVPLGQLRTMAPGHVFDLGRDLRHPVDVLLAGRKIGEGELVQVGERVGVRLRSVVPPR
jgi:type III secretion protein Q